MIKKNSSSNTVYNLNLLLDSISYAESESNPNSEKEKKPFHMAEETDEEKHRKIEEDLKDTKVLKKPLQTIMGIVVDRWFEIFVDFMIFVFILIPENCEFFHILCERFAYHKEKTKEYKNHTLIETFDLFSPILEGIVCTIHTVVFFCESFLGVEIPYGLLVAIVSSHIICLIILLHVEVIDRGRVKQTHIFLTYTIEVIVVLLSVLTTLLYIKTHERYQSLILICTVLVQYLCRTLTRMVLSTHGKFRKIFNSVGVRLSLFFSGIILLLLLQLSYIYFIEIS